MLRTVLDYCARIKNGRTIPDVYNAMVEEVNEICDEVDKVLSLEEPGEDGIIGESVDVILCAIDLIHQANPDISIPEIMKIVIRKCEKWERKYG